MTCYVCMICFNYVNNANLGMYCMVTGKVEHLTVSNNFILLLFLDLPYPTCDTCNGSSTSDCPCRCQAPRCSNCGVPSTSNLCERCQQLLSCRTCHRRLPTNCFSYNQERCQTCMRKSEKPYVRHSTGDVVTEVDIATRPEDTTFEVFMDRNTQIIQQTVDEYRQRLG